LLPAGDKDAAVGERLAGRVDREPAVERDLARPELQSIELGGSGGQQLALVRGADRACGWEDQAARAAPGVGRQLGELKDVAELIAFAELALADRARVGIGQRDQPIGDLLAGQSPRDLPVNPLGPIGRLLEPRRGGELCLRAAAACLGACLRGQCPRLADRARDQLARLPGELEHLLAGAPGAAQPPADGPADQPQPLGRRP